MLWEDFEAHQKTFLLYFFFAFAVVVASVALRVEATLVFISVAQLTEVYFQSTFQLFSAFFFNLFPFAKFIASSCSAFLCLIGCSVKWVEEIPEILIQQYSHSNKR